jgi:hypothetical protein
MSGAIKRLSSSVVAKACQLVEVAIRRSEVNPLPAAVTSRASHDLDASGL